MIVVCGGIVEKDGQYLLVQETQAKCYGKWNIPAGMLDQGETILEGAIRDVREECGLEVEPTAICQIGNRAYENDAIFIIFSTKVIGGDIQIDHDEIMDARWFSYDEIIAMGKSGDLRNSHNVLDAIDKLRNGIAAPLDVINIYERP